MSVKHPVDRGTEGPGHFDRVAERVSNVASSPAFFGLCMALVAAWFVSYAAGFPDSTRTFLGDMLAAVTLALVAMLKNSERRAEHAIQFKLDAIARALLEHGGDGDAQEELRRAIHREEEV